MDRWERGRETSASHLPHAHVLGIEGRGMTGLAQHLVQQGMSVTASDLEEPRNDEGQRDAKPFVSLAPRFRPGVRCIPAPLAFGPSTRLLLHGPEVKREHPTRLGALRRGVPQETPAGWLGKRMRRRIGVAVAGGREASVTSAMIGFVLAHAGRDPAVILGAHAPQLGGWSCDGSGAHLVAEWAGDASGFATLGPTVAVLLNVGGNPWVDGERWSSALDEYLAAVPADSRVLALGHPSLLDEGPQPNAGPGRFEWVALQRGADWWGTDLREESGRFRFRIFHRGRYVIEVRLRVLGLRNVVSALVAAAVCEGLGVPASEIRDGLEEFAGLSRDFEARGTYRGVTLVDDEAVDAASVRQALTLARRAYGGRRLWAVHAAESFPKESARDGGPGLRRMVAAFSGADRVLITDRDSVPQRTWSRECPARALTLALAAAAVWVRQTQGLVEAVAELDRHLEPGDVLVTLGAGEVGTIADAFIRRLSRDRQGG